MERAGERETAEQKFVCDELSHLTDLLKVQHHVGLAGACAVQICNSTQPSVVCGDQCSVSTLGIRGRGSVQGRSGEHTVFIIYPNQGSNALADLHTHTHILYRIFAHEKFV
jgi:hypothetical protein